jgi:hypothetical protein
MFYPNSQACDGAVYKYSFVFWVDETFFGGCEGVTTFCPFNWIRKVSYFCRATKLVCISHSTQKEKFLFLSRDNLLVVHPNWKVFFSRDNSLVVWPHFYFYFCHATTFWSCNHMLHTATKSSFFMQTTRIAIVVRIAIARSVGDGLEGAQVCERLENRCRRSCGLQREEAPRGTLAFQFFFEIFFGGRYVWMSKVENVESGNVESRRCQKSKMSKVKMSKCWNVEMSKCRNVEMSKCWNVEMSKCRNVEMSKCRNVEMSKCRNVEMSKCQNVKISKCWKSKVKSRIVKSWIVKSQDVKSQNVESQNV